MARALDVYKRQSYTFGGVNDLTVKSSKFTTKIMSIFEGAKLVYLSLIHI